MKKVRFPDALVLIFGLVVLTQLLSYVIPAGQYERKVVEINGVERNLVVPGTYQPLPTVEEDPENGVSPLPWWGIFTSIPKGMEGAGDVIFFVLLIGGAIGVVKATGALDAVILLAVRRFSGNPITLVVGLTALFAMGSAVIGIAEEYLVFLPLIVSMCLALKLDAMVAMGTICIGYSVGYGFATLNPFTVLIAQGIAGLPPASGQWYRWCLMLPGLAIGIHHLMRYAKKVHQDPSASLVKDVDYSEGFTMPEDVPLTGSRKLVLLALVASVIMFVVGIKRWDWYLTELAALFVGLGLLSGIVARLSPNKIASEFCTGASELAGMAIIIGVARTIEVVMDEALIKDTIVHAIEGTIQGLGAHLTAVAMLAVQSLTNLFIPSGSGQAYVTMPLLAPLADLTGVSKQVAVLAYQFGDGFTNIIVPTNAVIMGMLVMAKVSYQKWLRFLLPFFVKIYLLATIALVIAVAIGYE